MATHEGTKYEKTSTPKSVPKLNRAGIISKNRYHLLSFEFLRSAAFETFKYSFESIMQVWPYRDLNPGFMLEKHASWTRLDDRAET